MATLRTTAFASIPESTSQWYPWVVPGPLTRIGMPYAIRMETFEPTVFNPWMMKSLGLIHSTIFTVIAQKDHGKSTLLKYLLLLLRCMQAGSVDGVPQKMRSHVNDRKRENGRPEFEPVTKNVLQSEVVSLNQKGLINVFDPKLMKELIDIVETAINICETVSRRPLDEFQTLALQVGVWKMHKYMPDIAQPEVLQDILYGLNNSDLAAYRDDGNEKLLAKIEQKEADDSHPSLDRQMQNLRENTLRTINVSEYDFQRSAGEVGADFHNLLHGRFGNVFGGEHSLYDVLSRRDRVFDWTGLNADAVTMLAATFAKWQVVSENTPELAHLIPHISIGDEERTAFTNLMYLRYRAAQVEKARQSMEASFVSAQSELALTKTGSEGSEERELAELIVRGTGCKFWGRQANKRSVLDPIAEDGVSENDLKVLTVLPQGCWGVKIPGSDIPIEFIQVIVPDRVLRYMETNAAAARMTSYTPWISLDAVRERAKKVKLLDDDEYDEERFNRDIIEV